jgi:hypothetical protein
MENPQISLIFQQFLKGFEEVGVPCYIVTSKDAANDSPDDCFNLLNNWAAFDPSGQWPLNPQSYPLIWLCGSGVDYVLSRASRRGGLFSGPATRHEAYDQSNLRLGCEQSSTT